MSKNGLSLAVGLCDNSLSQIQGHYQNAVPFDGTRKHLSAVCTVTNLLAHSLYPLGDRCNLGDADVILLKESLDVNRGSILSPEWFPDRKNPWPLHFATLDAAPDESRVAQDGRDVKDG